MVDHLQSRVMPWRQYASHVKLRGTLSKMDVSTGKQNLRGKHLPPVLIAWFPLSQLRPRQRPISSQNKAIGVKDDYSTFNRFVFVSWSWYLSCNGNQALERNQKPMKIMIHANKGQ